MKKILLVLQFLLVCLFALGQSGEGHKTEPFVLGRIDKLQSVILAETRILNVYLPPGYNAADTTKYPVVYLLDGSADEDFIHVVGLYQFDSFEWINRVPKSIIVGIATVDRRRDFTFPTTVEADKKLYPTTGHSDKFISFLEKELQPYIQSEYKTNGSKTIIGESLGGLLATEILFKKPALFNLYIIVSPSLWWDNGSFLDAQFPDIADQFKTPTRIFIGVGKEGLTPSQIARTMEADANLLLKKIRNIKNPNLTVYFDYIPYEDHATIGHQAVYDALKMLGNKK